MSKKIETRACKGLEIREAPEDSGFIGILDGYAAVFNSDSVRFAGWKNDWIERINSGAFKRSLEEREDVAALWSHDHSQILARAPQTLNLEEDERGLKVEISLVDTTVNRDLVANVRAGNVDSMSFGFEVLGEEWKINKEKDNNDPDIRTLTDVELHEVSAVLWPAYEDTKLAVRSHEQFCKSQEEEVREEEKPTEDEQVINTPHLDELSASLGVYTKNNPKDNDE